MTPLSDGAIRARSGGRCECKGACGRTHGKVSRCQVHMGSVSSTKAKQPVLIILNGRHICERCAAGIESRAAQAADPATA
jgi:hypothetical protein